MTGLRSIAAVLGGAGTLLATLTASAGEPTKSTTKSDFAVIGNRTDKPDGTTAITVGRRLPTDWDTKIGVDVGFAAPASATPPVEAHLGGLAQHDRSSGAGWASVVVPTAPLGFDKTALEARLDPSQDQGKLATTLSRSLRIGDGVRLTVKNGYSLTNTLTSPAAPVAGQTTTASSPVLDQTLATENALSFDLLPTQTTLAAGAKLSSSDDRWLHSLSAEQKLFGGPISVTGTISERTDGDYDRSLKAGFKRHW